MLRKALARYQSRIVLFKESRKDLKQQQIDQSFARAIKSITNLYIHSILVWDAKEESNILV